MMGNRSGLEREREEQEQHIGDIENHRRSTRDNGERERAKKRVQRDPNRGRAEKSFSLMETVNMQLQK